MRLVLIGDSSGVNQLFRFIPREIVLGIIAASIRPNYLKELEKIAAQKGCKFLIQTKWKSSAYTAFVEELAAFRLDILWINSYSMIIRPDMLTIPTKGVVDFKSPVAQGKNRNWYIGKS